MCVACTVRSGAYSSLLIVECVIYTRYGVNYYINSDVESYAKPQNSVIQQTHDIKFSSSFPSTYKFELHGTMSEAKS